MHFRLFNKPAAFDIESGKARMWIDGVYEDYVAGEPYEGRVQIHGSVGLMKVEVLDSNLPPGASVFIDQITKEVVVKWLKYSPPVNEVRGVPNGSFETQDFWELVGPGTPAHIESGWSPDGKGNLTYRDNKGEYKVRGAWAPVSSNTRQIEIRGKVEHGKSSKGNAACAVGLAWYDNDRQLVREDIGSFVTNGGKGRWYDTMGVYSANNPAIRFVRPMVVFNRKKQNHPIHAGQITWDHVYEDGYLEDETKFVEVRVTDSTFNVAVHRGIIEENNIWLTSALYPTMVVEGLDVSQGLVGVTTGAAKNGNPIDNMTPSVGIRSVVFKNNVNEVNYSGDNLTPSIDIKRVYFKTNVVEVPYGVDRMSVEPRVKSVVFWRNAVNTDMKIDNFTPSIAIKKVTLK
ncbi:tail fiber [Stenotrophomonas phage Ponderosa]|uniref:Tail fiber n=1 Tax=Stenotrophomonas phage Ponderosa TaxID=2591103 RepID=A0A5B9NB94_9CAUD|nr:tail fiber [Stenotrophomonas phage Ponderosa]